MPLTTIADAEQKERDNAMLLACWLVMRPLFDQYPDIPHVVDYKDGAARALLSLGGTLIGVWALPMSDGDVATLFDGTRGVKPDRTASCRIRIATVDKMLADTGAAEDQIRERVTKDAQSLIGAPLKR